MPEQFPPLAGNSDLFLSRDFPCRVVLFGLSGKIEVGQQTIDSAMPPLDFLSDEQIVAVVNYVRRAFGNASLQPASMTPVDAATVASLRPRAKELSEQVFSEREKLRAAAKH